jgi:hypothetical protein
MPDQPRAVARWSDPETSWEAASEVAAIRESQWIVWSVLRHTGPKTDEQLFPIVLEYHIEYLKQKISESGCRTRRNELVKLGLVEHTGDYGKTRGGNRTRIWRAFSLEEYRANQNENAVQAELPL